jgi:hypothetical protein
MTGERPPTALPVFHDFAHKSRRFGGQNPLPTKKIRKIPVSRTAFAGINPQVPIK